MVFVSSCSIGLFRSCIVFVQLLYCFVRPLDPGSPIKPSVWLTIAVLPVTVFLRCCHGSVFRVQSFVLLEITYSKP